MSATNQKESTPGSLFAGNPLSRKWAYWELEDDKRRDVVWMDIIRKMFDFTTVEEFHHCLMYQPKISDVFTSTDGRRSKVTRTLVEGGRPRDFFVKAYMVMRKDVPPDYKQEIGGKRLILNAYTIRVSAGSMPLEDFTEKVWVRMCHLLVGEKLDPAECINGVWLEDTSRNNVALKLEVWFAIRDDAACMAICEELRRELQDSVTVENMFGDRHTLVDIPAFMKHSYFSEHNPSAKHGKHKFEKPGDFQGGELGGLPDGDLPTYPSDFLVNPPRPRLPTFGPGPEGVDGGGGVRGGGGGGGARGGGGRSNAFGRGGNNSSTRGGGDGGGGGGGGRGEGRTAFEGNRGGGRGGGGGGGGGGRGGGGREGGGGGGNGMRRNNSWEN